VGQSFFKELIRRNVFRVVAGYVVLAWLMAQVAELLLDTFGAPGWVMKSFLALLGVALPLVVYFAWAFELTPEGVKREQEVEREEYIAGQSVGKLNRAVIVLLLLALAWFAWDKYQPRDVTIPLESAPQVNPASDSLVTRSAGELPVVAVLPFKATGSDDGGFLAAGLHDDLLTRLARLSAYRVISRTSMMEYADTTKNMRQIGEELGAGYILEGGVQARGNRVRINAQLIHAPADEHLWADTYDRELTAGNLFDVQSELALAIAGELHTALSPDDRALMGEVPTDILDAYNAYLRGMQKREKWGTFGGPVPLREGIEAYEEAIVLDPDFAEAWAQLSITRSFAFQVSEDPELANAAMAALTRARQLKPDLLEVEIAWAQYIYRVLREYRQALDVLTSLGERVAGNAYALSMMAWLNRRLGHFEAAYDTLQRARLLEPRNIDTLTTLIHYAIRVDDCEAARRYAEQALPLAPESTAVKGHVAQFELECNGNAARASALLRGVDFTSNRSAWTLAWVAALHERDHDRALFLAEDESSLAGWALAPSLGPIFRELNRAVVFRYLSLDESAALDAIEAAGLLFPEVGLDVDAERSEVYAGARFFLYSMMGEVDLTRHWIAEHIRRYREEYKGDLAEEAKNRYSYAASYASVGLYDEAVKELRLMLEEPGGHRFPYIDGFPEFDVLDDHPGYTDLRERFGGVLLEQDN